MMEEKDNEEKKVIQEEQKEQKKSSTEFQNNEKNSPKDENKKPQETQKTKEQQEPEKITTPKENIEQPEKKQDTQKKHIIPIIITTAIACITLIFSVIFALLNINNDKILPNISIMGINVAGLGREEAINQITEIAKKQETIDITLKHEKYETTINGKQFNAKFDIETAVNEAYNIGKDGNIIQNNYSILFTKLFKKDIEMQMTYNEEELNKQIKNVSSKIPEAVKQSNYYVEGEKLIIVNGKKGLTIKETELKTQIINNIKKLDNQNSIINIEVETVEPDKIDLEKIRNEIYKEPQDAYISKNPTVVHPHSNGIDFKISIEEAQKIINQNKKEYKIPLKITLAKKTIRDLGEEAFPEQISTFTTRFDPSNYNRSNNLSLAANKIDGTILMPGEVFSYNKVVGARTIAAGYKEAGAYAGGGVVQEVGGGICQISSTIYNTALLANLEIVERTNHQFETSYVQPSRDATVSWGYLDFKFKNNRTYPIIINASAKNGIAKVSFHGIKEKTEYAVTIESIILAYIPTTVKYIEDSTLEEGKEIVEQAGYNGCKSEGYKILALNGKTISKTLLSRDTYDPMQRIIRRGTKKVIQKPTTPTKPNNQQTN